MLLYELHGYNIAHLIASCIQIVCILDQLLVQEN